MLNVLLTPSDGGTAWRHLLREAEARAGWEVVGPLGLLRRVGRLLGLRADPAPAPERLAAFAARLAVHDKTPHSYSASRSNDPFGVAAFLLAIRDRLRAAGWDRGALAASRRLADIAELELLAAPGLPDLPPGLADRERELARALDERGALPEPLSIALMAPREAFAPSLLLLIEALARAGAQVTEAPEDRPRAPAETDLGRLQRALLESPERVFRPDERPRLAGDGSVLVLEADTPAEAAELTACICRDRSLSGTTLVLGSEGAVLDAALTRQGLPTVGAGAASRWRPALQILPLRLALAFRPRDPLRAAELLLLPVSPLPRHVRKKLLNALSEMPGLWGPAWNEAVEDSLAEEGRRAREAAREASPGDGKALEVAEREAKERLRTAIEAWYGGEGFDPQEGIPATKAAAICEAVASWAQARGAGTDPSDAALLHAASVARSLQRLLGHLPPGQNLPRLSLEQLHDNALGDGADHASFEGEAGRPALCHTAAEVLAGADDVIWWGFVGDEGGFAPEPWTEAERIALSAAGLKVPAPGEVRKLESWGWRRPALSAARRLVLVRWRLSGCEGVARYPFQDELETRLAPGSLEACTVDSRTALAGDATALLPDWKRRVSDHQPAEPLTPRAVWRLPPETITPSGSLSPTTIERLFSCPMGWVLEQRARLEPGRVARIPDGSLLLGAFGHAILEDMLLGAKALDLAATTPEQAAEWASRAFDERVEAEAAPLVLPGRDVERAIARRLVCEAAAALVGILKESGWKPLAAEKDVQGDLGDAPVHGRVDLIIERRKAPGIIDLKLGNGKRRREELEKGRAVQLALYSAMLRRGGAYPPTGYFVLEDGQLLTTTPDAFARATAVDGPSTHETVEGVKKGLAYWRRVLATGVVPSTREELEDWREPVEAAAGEPLPEEGAAEPEAGCRFCKFETLCAVRLAPEANP